MSSFEPRTAVVTIYTGDYLDRIRHLERLAEAAKEADEGIARTLDEGAEYLRLAEEHDALVKEAEAAAVHVRVKALPRKTWKQLVSEHPLRDGHRADGAAGVNEDTFKDALVTCHGVTESGLDYRTIIGPADFDDETLEELSDVDFDRIYLTAFALNRGVVATPKASLVSRMTRPSDETSSSPAPPASH